MTYIKKFHLFENNLFERVPFRYVLWYQEYLKEKIKELGDNSHETGPNDTLEDTEDYSFLTRRVSSVFEKIVNIYEELGCSSEKFKDYRKKYRNTEYIIVISHLDSIYETVRNYKYNKYPKPAYDDICSLISSWNTAKDELKKLSAQHQVNT